MHRSMLYSDVVYVVTYIQGICLVGSKTLNFFMETITMIFQ